MHARHVLLVVALASTVALAGCLGSPSSGPNAPPGNESFTIAVGGNSTHSVYVAAHLYQTPVESVTLVYANDTTREFDLPAAQGLTQGPAPDGLRTVDVPEDDGGVGIAQVTETPAPTEEPAATPTPAPTTPRPKSM